MYAINDKHIKHTKFSMDVINEFMLLYWFCCDDKFSSIGFNKAIVKLIAIATLINK